MKSANSKTVTSDILASLPLACTISGVLQMAPGAVGGSIYGDGRGEYGGVMDDIQLVEPDVGGAYMGSDTGMAWDMVEEAEIVTAGATAQYYGSASGLTNIVTKSGGNKFSGEAS
ncbi:MAG: hypothetical protein MUQ25_20110, partial [Candidatus Aminicenantes bacterium]|nr:hypothetical protein [Candidatus Aminicenantes bacterium]